MTDFSVGDPDAPVHLVEYASITCPVCKAWHDGVWPEFKAAYVDTGEVYFTFRELPTAPAEISVAGFLIARCAANGSRYLEVVDTLFERQTELVQGGREALFSVAREYGMNEAAFNVCLRDESHIAAINANIDRADADGVSGTPAFVFPDGEVISGLQPMSAFQQRLDAPAAD